MNQESLNLLRIVADSRSVGLYHTSGLSTPQQIQMALFALTSLITKGRDPYIESSKNLVREISWFMQYPRN